MYNFNFYNPVKVLFGTGGKKTPANPAIPIICITTNAGTASEVDIASV